MGQGPDNARRNRYLEIGLSLGVAIGAVLGVLLDNLALSVGIGWR